MRRINRFKLACVEYLETQTIQTLRAYGRFLQMRDCTSIKKGELIRGIVEILCGERVAVRSNRGAPSKRNFVEPSVIQTIEDLKEKYFSETGAPIEEISIEDERKNDCCQLKEVPISGKVNREGAIVILSEYLGRMGVRENEELSQKLYEDENGELLIILRKIKNG